MNGSLQKSNTDNSIEITTHILVPKHRKLSDEETNTILEKLNISKDQFPKILKSDPAIKNLNSEVNDIIEIERDSVTAGKKKYYRVVVNG